MATPTVAEVQEKYKALSGTEVVANGDTLTFAMSVEGLEGTGKTSFGLLTCPTPLIHVNFGDRDPTPLLYDASEERRKGVTLYSMHAQEPTGWSRAEAKESLFALSDIARAHLSNGGLKGGTFVLDSGSTWWEAMREVYVAPKMEKREREGGKSMGGLEYDQANLIVSGVLNWIKNQGAFLVLTHQKAQEWDNKGPIPGKYKPKQNSRVPALVEVRLDVTKECGECGAPECMRHSGRRHFGQLLKFSRNTAFEGMRFENPSFKLLYSMYAGKEFPREEALL